MKVSTYDLMGVLFLEGGPLDHVEIAERMHAPAHRVCISLAYLKNHGKVECLRKSRTGRGELPGLWNLTAKGNEQCVEAEKFKGNPPVVTRKELIGTLSKIKHEGETNSAPDRIVLAGILAIVNEALKKAGVEP